MAKCCDVDHGAPGAGHMHGRPPPIQRPLTPEEIEFKKKVEAHRQELIAIANFISNKGLKQKIAQFQEGKFDYFRGKTLYLVNV
jgi:hypothetical protein